MDFMLLIMNILYFILKYVNNFCSLPCLISKRRIVVDFLTVIQFFFVWLF